MPDLAPARRAPIGSYALSLGASPFTTNTAAQGVAEGNSDEDGAREHHSEHDEARNGLS
jgi:hypothetical protein